MEAAERARLRAVASTRAEDGTEPHFGVVRSFRLGSIPLWLAGGRFPCTVGSVNGHGPRLVCLSTGEPGVTTSEKFATRRGLEFDAPRTGSGGALPPDATGAQPR